MRRWRLPFPLSKRLRLPSSSGDETRSRLETRLVDRARGWPLVWFIFVGRSCGPSAQSRAGGPRQLVTSFEASGTRERANRSRALNLRATANSRAPVTLAELVKTKKQASVAKRGVYVASARFKATLCCRASQLQAALPPPRGANTAIQLHPGRDSLSAAARGSGNSQKSD